MLMRSPSRCPWLLLLASTGCAGSVEVTRTYAPQAALQAQNESRLRPVAVVRSNERVTLPSDARLEPNRVVLPTGESSRDGPTTLSLGPGDSVEMRGSFQPDETVPGGGRVESSRSTGFLIAGVVVLSLSYVPTAYVGLGSSRTADRVLVVPALGPWIDLANRPQCVPPQLPFALPVDPCLGETASRAALVTSGVLQDVGLLLTLAGLPAQSRFVAGPTATGSRESRGHFAIVPTLGGAAAVGTF